MSSVLQDLLSDELTETQVKVEVTQQFDLFVEAASVSPLASTGSPRSQAPGKAKSLMEFNDLVRQAIEDYETRQGVLEQNKIVFTEEEPDADSVTETITFSLIDREPGAYSEGPPRKGRVKNRRPLIREVRDDDENPGYRLAIYGMWYDNIVRFTCWAKTNKAVNSRATWFEDLMEDYTWWLVAQGVKRVLYEGQKTDIVTVIRGNKWYGRALDYFVQTEKLRVFSEKTLEEILIKLTAKERVIN